MSECIRVMRSGIKNAIFDIAIYAVAVPLKFMNTIYVCAVDVIVIVFVVVEILSAEASFTAFVVTAPAPVANTRYSPLTTEVDATVKNTPL